MDEHDVDELRDEFWEVAKIILVAAKGDICEAMTLVHVGCANASGRALLVEIMRMILAEDPGLTETRAWVEENKKSWGDEAKIWARKTMQ